MSRIGASGGSVAAIAARSAAPPIPALALGNVRTVEMGGPLPLAADVGDPVSCYERDRIRPPGRPGLGLAPDEARVRRFAEAWWTVTA